MSTRGWMRYGSCVAGSSKVWITDTDRLPKPVVEAMTAICHCCPVREHCAAYADRINATGGFWAGRDRGLPTQPTLPGVKLLGGDAA
ncbi:MAG: WhiB family transcriptional regulator [Nocardioides sp.]|nr:WhiB family transcriptional regulator [Nocardioides sp.]